MMMSTLSEIAMESSVSSFKPGVRVDEQVIQLERIDRVAQPVVQDAYVVAFAEHAHDLPGLHARRDQVDLAVHGHRTRTSAAIGYVIRRLLDAAFSPQIVVQGVVHLFTAHPEDGMDAW